MSRILDERDKQKLESNIYVNVAAINETIRNLQEDWQENNDDVYDTINSHKQSRSNPHGVTASQVGADSIGSASQALADAKEYTDTRIQSYTETDPTVPSWAKAASKPTYTASEVGAMDANVTSLKNPYSITFTGAYNVSYDGSAALTINIPDLPTISAENEGKVLCVVNGAYSFKSITDLLAGATNA